MSGRPTADISIADTDNLCPSAPDVPANDHLADILVSCECEECTDAEECGCQDPSELTDGVGNKVFAYSKRVSTRSSASAPRSFVNSLPRASSTLVSPRARR